jgi:hypothetical protein
LALETNRKLISENDDPLPGQLNSILADASVLLDLLIMVVA